MTALRYYERVTVTQDVHGVDGRLRVQSGASGVVCSDDRGHLGVLFDDGPAYVELSGCKRRFQEVPRLGVHSDGQFFALMGRRFRVLETFPDTDAGTDSANEYMEANPGASVLAVAHGVIILADKNDKGVPVPVRDL